MKKNLNIFFIIGLFLLELSSMCVNVTFLQNHIFKIKLLSLILLFFNGLFNILRIKLNKKEWLVVFFSIIIGIISYMITSDFLILEIILLLISSSSLNFDNVVKYDFFIKLIVVLLLYFLYKFGYTNAIKIYRPNGFLRQSYGFFHPNTFSMFISMMYIDLCYILRNNSNKITVIGKYLLGLIFGYVVFHFADSRTSGFIIFIFMFLMIFEKQIEKLIFKRKDLFVLKNSYIILTFVCLISTILFIKNNSIITALDNKLSYRISIQSMYLKQYHINLFGNNITFIKSLDNTYLRFLLNYGIMGIIVFNKILKEMIKKSFSSNNYYVLVISILIIVYGILEMNIYNIVFNIFLLYSVHIIKKNNNLVGVK